MKTHLDDEYVTLFLILAAMAVTAGSLLCLLQA
jgi:hypothetical protein